MVSSSEAAVLRRINHNAVNEDVDNWVSFSNKVIATKVFLALLSKIHIYIDYPKPIWQCCVVFSFLSTLILTENVEK